MFLCCLLQGCDVGIDHRLALDRSHHLLKRMGQLVTNCHGISDTLGPSVEIDDTLKWSKRTHRTRLALGSSLRKLLRSELLLYIKTQTVQELGVSHIHRLHNGKDIGAYFSFIKTLSSTTHKIVSGVALVLFLNSPLKFLSRHIECRNNSLALF